jgi:predicted AlkP superfamily pyrophosphatase or phosphodiesterase
LIARELEPRAFVMGRKSLTSLRVPLVALLALAATASAQGRAGTAPRLMPSQPPTLLVFITVDQLREDYLEKYAPQFTGGLARLVRGGAFFTNAMLDYATTETAPGHATGMSGRFPSHTGIVSNSLGVFDVESPVIGDARAFASPFRFRGGTLTDWLRMKDPRTRAISVSRKDRGAILPLGRTHQEVYWYDYPTGNFTTSSWYAAALPEWLQAVNAKRLPAMQAGKVWTPLLPDSAYAEPDSVIYENFGTDFMFAHPMPADTAAALRALPDSPYMDELTLQVALTGMKQTNLGVGPWTDVLAISLSTTDAIGHRYGPDSKEIHDQILRLDRELGTFFDSLFAVRDPAHVIIALTADHGVAPIPEWYVATQHKPAQRVNLDGLAARIDSGLAKRGVDPADFRFEDEMLFVQREALARAGINADSLVRDFARAAAAMPGVQKVYRRAELAKDTLSDPAARRWYHSLPADFPVELVVVQKEFSVWGTYAPAIHGSVYDYDNHVPVIFYGAPFKAGHFSAPARLVDMAPTLAWATATMPADLLDGGVLWSALK